MGISTAGHLPSITSTSFPALTSHLLSAYNAQRIGNWTVTVRVLRSSLSSTITNTNLPVRAKLMYVVQMSEFPEETFTLIEDFQCETRASIRTKHAHALSLMQAAAMAAAAAQSQPNGGSIPIVQPSNTQLDSLQPNTTEIPPNDIQEDVKMQENNSIQSQDGQQKEETNENTNAVSQEHENRLDSSDGQESLFGPSDEPSSDPPIHQSNVNTEMTTVQEPEPVSAAAAAIVQPPPQVVHSYEKSTRLTLFSSSSQFMLLLSRLNLPAPLGAPSMGDGISTNISAGPGAWIPRGAPVIIQGATYDIPSSATGYGSGDAEWRVRLGMVQSGGTRSAGAIVESEYLPLLRLANDTFLINHLQSLFPNYLLNPQTTTTTTNSQLQSNGGPLNGQNANSTTSGIANPVPTPEQWQEVIPASNKAWMESVGIIEEQKTSKTQSPPKRLPTQQKDRIGWCGKERGRRLAFLYITLLRNQSVI